MLKLKPFAFVLVGILSTLGALSLTHVGPASAQSPGVNLAQLVAQVNALQSTVTSQAAIITALQTKTAPLTLSGTDLTITGVNVHIVNGQGSTEAGNGLGNLIVGYNESRGQFGGALGADARTGSHNIITGEYNNYTSAGGIVGGYGNSLSGVEEFAVGAENSVSGHQASIAGGISGAVNADYAFAPAPASSPFKVSGTDVTLSGYNLHIVSGSGYTDDGTSGEIKNAKLSGLGNLVIGYNATHNNSGNTRTGSHNLILGDQNNYESYGGIVAGKGNTISASYASVSGGYNNTASADCASVGGGASNTASRILRFGQRRRRQQSQHPLRLGQRRCIQHGQRRLRFLRQRRLQPDPEQRLRLDGRQLPLAVET